MSWQTYAEQKRDDFDYDTDKILSLEESDVVKAALILGTAIHEVSLSLDFIGMGITYNHNSEVRSISESLSMMVDNVDDMTDGIAEALRDVACKVKEVADNVEELTDKTEDVAIGTKLTAEFLENSTIYNP